MEIIALKCYKKYINGDNTSLSLSLFSVCVWLIRYISSYFTFLFTIPTSW